MDMVQNARIASDLDHVYDLTMTLLQYGADPNINISTTEPMICHSQSSVFLKKSSNQVTGLRPPSFFLSEGVLNLFEVI